MKKKNIMYALISILFLSLFFGITNVHAEEYTGEAIWPSEKISNIFIRKYRVDGYIKYQQASFIRRSEDNKFVYCLQPYADIDNNLPYYSIARSDYETYLNMTKDQWNRIALLAYYGYQYKDNGYDHTNNKWYAITQVMIWRTAEPTSRIVFTDTLNGNDLPNKFTDEIAEIENLVANHKVRPSFDMDNITIPLGQTITLTDTNGVLNKYEVVSTNKATATISGNTLSITSTGIGDSSVRLVKKSTYWSGTPVVYFSNHSQNVMRVGSVDPIYTDVNFKSIGGRVEIYKLDNDIKDSYPQGNATLGGAIYGIYNEKDEKVGEITTDNYGYGISDYLPTLGRFYAKEIKSSKGYELDDTKYYFDISENKLLVGIDVYEKVIKVDIDLFKVFANAFTGMLKGEPNITFDIYLKNCNPRPELKSRSANNMCYYDSITTDKNGYAKITLPYGEYLFKQVNTTQGYEKVEDFSIIVNENTDKKIYKLISNAEIQAKLKLIKVDSESRKILVRDGIKFRIKNLDTGEYVCQNVTYPGQEKICVFETKDGMFITPYVLGHGNYQIEELEEQSIPGYVWNSVPLKFSIDENSKFIQDDEFGLMLEVQFENKEVKGEVEIKKVGEKLVIENGTFRYEEIELDGVHYDLIADGDIYSGDGTLIYKDKQLIKSFVTKDGYFKLTNLYLGKYCLIETKTVGNHVLNSKPYCFEIKYKDQYTDTIKLIINQKNYLAKGDFELSKVDLSTGEPVEGALIEIYTEDDILIYSGRTDKSGKLYVKGLESSKKYKFVEKEAPEGYILNDEIHEFEILNNGDIVKDTLSNEKIVIDVPNTFANDYKILIPVSLCGLGIVLVLLSRDKRKKK